MGNSCHERNDITEHQAVNVADKVSQEYIGAAEMLADGTIVLTLRAQDKASGGLGDSQFKYPPDHAQYKSILHILACCARAKQSLSNRFHKSISKSLFRLSPQHRIP
jgi:hypothetical protein